MTFFRSSTWRYFTTILSFSLFGSATMMAQTGFCTSSDAGSRCAGFHLAGREYVVKGQPFQAEAITEVQQTTANGTHISRTSTATVARDSEGRTMRTESLGSGAPQVSAISGDPTQASGPVAIRTILPESSSEAGKTTLTTIFDPVAGKHIDYVSDSKVAHVITIPDAASAPAPSLAEAGVAAAPESVTIAGAAPGGMDIVANAFRVSSDASSNSKTESLGTRTIDGVAASGTRTTRTIPAGAIGNDKDIVITQETWYSPDLQLVLESIHNDPRYGQTTYSITNLDRSEPDASLFQVPPGYTVENLKPQISGTIPGPGAQ